MCTSNAHKEYDCRVKYSLGPKKFTYPKWCPACKEKFKDLEQAFTHPKKIKYNGI